MSNSMIFLTSCRSYRMQHLVENVRIIFWINFVFIRGHISIQDLLMYMVPYFRMSCNDSISQNKIPAFYSKGREEIPLLLE